MSKSVMVFTASNNIMLSSPVIKIAKDNPIKITTKTLVSDWVARIKQIRFSGSTFDITQERGHPLYINDQYIGNLIKS